MGPRRSSTWKSRLSSPAIVWTNSLRPGRWDRTLVVGELAAQGRSPATVETLAFARAVRAATTPLLDSFRTAFRAAYGIQTAELEESLGLFSHMTRLSERQFDVLVLHDALGFDTRHTALIMGISQATVRSTRRTAKHRLATAMGLRFDDSSDHAKE